LHSHMKTADTNSLRPRKMPRQARSEATVAAIYEATIQVLLTQGLRRLTTTRVAERAGVSVGTLYQYFPNKHALLYSLLEHHLNDVATKVESACRDCRGRNLSDVTASIVHAYMSAKTDRVDESRVLYQVFAELNATELVGHTGNRINSAITGALASVRDAHFDDLPTAVFILRGAMSGVTRSLLEHNAMLQRPGDDTLSEQTTLLCMAYLCALADRKLPAL
jgi:AcrR family transcriptional regulator